MTKFAMLAVVCGATASVAAADTLSQWNLQGAPGDQAFTVGASGVPRLTARSTVSESSVMAAF